MDKFVSVATAFLLLTPVAASAVQTASVGWPETIQLLTKERSQAEACIGLLKATGDKAAITAARITYVTAKPEADAVIAGLTIALVQGGKPESLPGVLASLDRSGIGLQQICDAAVRAASARGGTKDVRAEIAKDAIASVMNDLPSAVGGLWKHYFEKDPLELQTIRTQLEAAKWPEFGDIAPAR